MSLNSITVVVILTLAVLSTKSFVDDTLIFCKANSRDITNLKLILYPFADIYGLAINVAASFLIYIFWEIS